MLNVIAWRVAFELANFAKFLTTRGEQNVFCFAYGANLSDSVLQRRKIRLVSRRPFVLKNYQLNFKHPSPFAGVGFASVEPSESGKVYGELLEFSKLDALRMDFYELVPILQRYKRIVHQQDGIQFYFYQTGFPAEGLEPTSKYLSFITDYLESRPDVDSLYLNELKNKPTKEFGEKEKDLWFFLPSFSKLPYPLNEIGKNLDSLTLKYFVKYLRDKSLLEKHLP